MIFNCLKLVWWVVSLQHLHSTYTHLYAWKLWYTLYIVSLTNDIDPCFCEKGYKEKIVDIREEILRKRRAGKLPGDTTSVLKSWWQSHSKWPYPTEEDKARLVQETGLQLKQINNWFINQRKRNWHSNPSSSTVSKNKRRSNAGENSGRDRWDQACM